jgi:uncharacterized protein YydD (DUF2326 family)
MICEISSSLPTFKSVQFHCGLNVFLADSTNPAEAGATRNSSGKTSLIEIIHFLLGANIEEGSIFKLGDLADVSFFGIFFLKGDLWRVSRHTTDPSRIIILQGNCERYGLRLKIDKRSENQYLSVSTWKELLGHCYFGLPIPTANTPFDEPYSPTFRSLFGFFARRVLEGGFLHVNRYADKQQEIEAAINLCFLLDLDWRLTQEFIRLRERRRVLDRLQKASENELFATVLGKASELRPQVTAAERRMERLTDEVENFRVVEAYQELSRRATQYKGALQDWSRREVLLRENLANIERALEDVKPPDKIDVQTMYQAIGIELPGVAVRRFDEVAKFHDSVVDNRKQYLSRELDRIRENLGEADKTMSLLGERRAAVLRELDGAGALKDLTSLQALRSEAETKLALLRGQLEAAERIEGEGTQIGIDALQLQQRTQNDIRERHAALDRAQRLLLEFSGKLYKDRDATLQIDTGKTGLSIDLKILGDRGGGVHNVEVFLMDLVLFELCCRKNQSGNFLIHDSHLFDGVDERQVAECLNLGADVSWLYRGQYIVTMNSDVFGKLPTHMFPARDQFVVSTRVTDEPDGGLFGVQFSS